MKNKGVNHRQLSEAVAAATAQNASASTIKTIKKTIGGVGVSGCDFNFATAENTTEQVIDLGAIIPAKAKVLDVHTQTVQTFTGATTLAAEAGTTSSGHELLASATIYAAGATVNPPDLAHQIVAPATSAAHVYIAATPGANWSNVTAGKVEVYITYLDVAGL